MTRVLGLLTLPVLLGGAIASFAITSTAIAIDNGPQSLACDYSLDKLEGTDTCLIIGSGTNQGISWVVFEVVGQRFRYNSSTPKIIEHIDEQSNVLGELSVINSYGQCRPGGRDADIYDFSNGDRVCIYW